jgi:hypothetical protein
LGKETHRSEFAFATSFGSWHGLDRTDTHFALLIGTFDFSSISPVERIELADTLHDSATQLIDWTAGDAERVMLATHFKKLVEFDARSMLS